MTRIKVYLVEDERIVAQTLAAMFEDMGHEIAGMAHDIESAREGLEQSDFDLAVLDINLKTGSEGIELAKMLVAREKPFFFVSSYTDMATVQAAKSVQPGAYVVKPFSEQDLFIALEMTMMRMSPEPVQSVMVRKGNAFARIALKDIQFMKSENVYVELHSNNKVWLKRSTLKELLSEVNSDKVIQVHRSYAVNKQHVSSFSNHSLKVADKVIPISRSFRDRAIQEFKNSE